MTMVNVTSQTQTFSVFLSLHGSDVAGEFAALQALLRAYAEGVLAAHPADADLFVGVYGGSASHASITEFEQATRAKVPALIFTRKPNYKGRDSTLSEFLRYTVEDYPSQNFHDNAELVGLVQPHFERLRERVSPAWRSPALPLRDRHFAARENDLKKLSATLLKDSTPLILTGAAGVGKSALALELAYRLRDHFTAGVFWLERCGEDSQHRPLESALRELASATPEGREAIARRVNLKPSQIKTWLSAGRGRALVIMDDVNSPAALLEVLAALPSDYALLVNARSAPPDLGWPSYTLKPFSVDDGLSYLHHALEMPPNLAAEALQPLRQIVEQVGGDPLALRLAAGWMSRAGGWQAALVYLGRWADSPDSLAGLFNQAEQAADAPQLEKPLGLLYNSLSAREKGLFTAAGAFPPDTPFSAEALISAAGSGLLEDVESLTAGLFLHDLAHAGYRLPQSLHPYAARLLAQSGQVQRVRHGHLRYYEQMAEHWTGEASPIPSISSAHTVQMRWAFEALNPASRNNGSAFALGLIPFVLKAGGYLHKLGYDAEVKRWLHATLDSQRRPNAANVQPTALRALADLSSRAGDITLAQAFYERALLLYYAQKSLSGQANTLKALGDLHASANQREQAQDYYDRTLQLYAQIDFQLGRANTLKALGDLSLAGVDYPTARDYYQRTLALYEQIDFQLGQAHTLRALGDLYSLEREPAAARHYYSQALSLYQDIHFQSQQAATLIQIGRLDLEAYDSFGAQAAFEEALRLYQACAEPLGEAEAYAALGDLHQHERRNVEAIRAYEQAEAQYMSQGGLDGAAAVGLKLAEAYAEGGANAPALEALLRVQRIHAARENPAALEQTQRHLREFARHVGHEFNALWRSVTGETLPAWLTLVPKTTLPQQLLYAVRDFMLAESWPAARRIVERHQDILLTDEADEAFARMLRQYAGQAGPTRQIDKYRALLQRCRQIGIAGAFDEISQPSAGEPDSQSARLRHQLDAYDEALIRLRDLPLVYASIQINRANTLRELASLPNEDQLHYLGWALKAYDDALHHQENAPLDYAQTQIQRAATLRQLAYLPGVDQAGYMHQVLAAYDDALEHQRAVPEELTRTQLQRAATLHELAGLLDDSNEIAAYLSAALVAYEEALAYLQQADLLDYARTQTQLGGLLHEMAGLPNEDFRARMVAALTAYEEALEYLRDVDSLDYAKTQNQRVALLRDLAGLPGEERATRLYQALAASNEALRYLTDEPLTYAQAQINRAHLQREIAGLAGEHRLARMREALATYNDALGYFTERPLDYAAVQSSRAALLREMAGLSGENNLDRLQQALQAAAEAYLILERLDRSGVALRNAQRMLKITRQAIVKAGDDTLFRRWWSQHIGTTPPEWLFRED